MPIANKLQDSRNQQKRLAEVLTAKGVPATATEKYDSLVDKVAQIEELRGEERTLTNVTSVLSEPKSVVQLEYPTPKTLNAKLGSKNLFDSSTESVDTFINVNTGIVGAQAGYTTSDYIPVSKATYTINYCRIMAFYDANKNFIRSYDPTSTVKYTFTINDETQYIRFAFASSKENVQMELGSTVTAYAPYISDFSTVTVTRYGATETDNPQTYTPTTSGEVIGITSLFPITTLITDNAGVVFEQVLQENEGNTFIEVLPSTGKNGITKINQPIVDSSVDDNITPENIKKDVSILGVTGTYEGTSSASVDVEYTYDESTKVLTLLL